jgi:hypothetical protein
VTVADAELGAALRRAGLSPRATQAAWGTTAIAALARPLRALPPTPATAALRLLVAGVPVGRADVERGLGAAALAGLVARGIVADDGGPELRAAIHVVPVGPSLVACDRAAWPDDSTHHLADCVPPGRAERWLDLGTGCGTVPLTRPDRARTIVATEVEPRALALAALGVALSDVRHVTTLAADLLDGAGECYDLVTFNLPIPAEAGLTRFATRPPAPISSRGSSASCRRGSRPARPSCSTRGSARRRPRSSTGCPAR